MSVSIYDVIPKIKSFLPFKDSESISYANPDLCGPKQYVVSNSMTSIAKPASNLINTDKWTISAVYNEIAQVGDHIVTVTATLADYPSVVAKSVTFNLTVIDDCATAKVTS